MLRLATSAGAQDWQPGWKGNVEYNCDAVMGIAADVCLVYCLILLQMYLSADHFPMGADIVQLKWNGRIFRCGMEAQDHALFAIHVYCDRPESE